MIDIDAINGGLAVCTTQLMQINNDCIRVIYIIIVNIASE